MKRMMKRLFLAIKITPAEQFLKVYYQLLKSLEGEQIKWVEPGNLHITLKFFGETPEEKITIINDVAEKTLENYTTFWFQLSQVGIFGSSYKPRVIWFGIQNNEEISKLGNDLIESFHQAGFENDRQNFVPHLSVGRIKFLNNKRKFQDTISKYKNIELQKVEVNEILLYESVLQKSGPIYEVIRRFRLHDFQ